MHQFVHDYQLVSTTMPNAHPEVTSKDNAEITGFFPATLNFVREMKPQVKKKLGSKNGGKEVRFIDLLGHLHLR